MAVQENAGITRDTGSNQREFGGFYDAYADKVYSYIYRKTSHRETAEDLTSQTFFKALDNFSSFDPSKGSGSAWILRIARNTVIDHYRTKKVEMDIDELAWLEGGGSPAADYERTEAREEADRFLKSLDPSKREVVTLRLWDGLSWKEIAAILGKSEASCKMVFGRSVEELKKIARSVIAILTGANAINIWIK